MAVQISVTANALLQQVGKNPQIILDIEGVDLIFGALPVFKTLFWDDESEEALWDNNLFWDGLIKDSKSRDYISLDGTTTSITQQIAPDKGSTSSISTVEISLIDKNKEVSRAFALDSIGDILGRKAIFSIGFAQGAYPEDTTPIFRGVIVDFYTEAGKIFVSLASPETLKRQLFLEKFQTELNGAINNSITTITLASTAGIYPTQDALTSYIRVDDELMRIVSIDSPTQLTVQRSQLTTVAASHDSGAGVDTFYTLTGKPIDIALKVMLSKEGNQFFTSLDTPKSIEFVSLTESIDNAIIFDYFDIEEKTGLRPGDLVKLNSPSNTGTFTVSFFGKTESGDSYIIVNESLNQEIEYAGTFEYISKYNTLPTGLGMLTSEVDVEQFELINGFFGASFVQYVLYVKDSIDNAKDFIDQEIFFPQGLYSIPRKARSSVKFIAPPFSSEIVPYLGVDAVLNPDKIRQRRSVHKYHYNTYVFRYNVDSIEDRFLNGKIIISSNSLERIPVGKKQLLIESNGLRNNPETTTMIDNVGQRMVDRYQFAPVYFDNIEVNYESGYRIEVGDIVPFGGLDLQVTDIDTGNRGTDFKLFEVINKSLNVKNGNVKLSLVSTAFDIDSRYAVVGLSSFVGDDSTTTRVRIRQFSDTGEYFRESDKWPEYQGQIVAVRSEDYSFYEEVVFQRVDPADRTVLILSTPLSVAPLNGYIIEPAEYKDQSTETNDRFKIEFVHHSPLAQIISVLSASQFEVDFPGRLLVGSNIFVSSEDFVRDSFESKREIDSIVGSLVTLSAALPFTPSPGDFVKGSDFQDGGSSYALI